MAPSTWRKIFLIKYNNLHHKKKKVVFDRSSTVPITFTRYSVWIYAGKKLKPCFITRWMVGFKFGEFTWNRRLALYKAKQLRKKKKKK
jgi:ribosomal protein S19